MFELLRRKKLSFRFTALTLIALVVGLFIFGWVLTRGLGLQTRAQAEWEARTQLDNIFDNLELIDELSSQQVRTAMTFLQLEARRTGDFQVRGSASLNGEKVPNLVLGSSSLVGNYELVDRTAQMTGCTATIFVKNDKDFVRVSTNILKPDGTRAIGTVLDPNGPAIAAIREGRPFYGVVDILGAPYITGYEPARDRAGRIIAIYYVGYPLKTLAGMGENIKESKILDHGFVALLDSSGKTLFESDGAGALGAHDLSSLVNTRDWIYISRSYDKWGYTFLAGYPLSDVSDRMESIRLKIFLCAALIALTIALIQAFLIARFVVSPVRQLASRMQVAEPKTAFSGNNDDEVGVLAQGFDYFVAKIEDRDRRLLQNQQNLEEQIALRTADLVAANSQLKLQAAALQAAANSIVITDLKGAIVWTNPAFTSISGYSAEEVLGKNPRIWKSGRQDKSFYASLWETICSGRTWRGELDNRRKNGALYTEEMTITPVKLRSDEISHFVAIKQDVSDRKRATERVKFLAYYDALTSLPNRTLLQDRLEKALAGARRRKEKVAILFLDLDGFKNINDSLGHSVGDLLLKGVADRLQNWAREQDTVSRVGGDEFLVLLNGVKDFTDAAVAAERIMDAMTAEFVIQGHPLSIRCSIGITIFPEHGTDGESLIKNADSAMYSAKESGRDSFRFFTADMNDKALERLTLENGLRVALARNEFFLVYQPQTNIASGSIIGFEALIRWRHPKLGLVPPDKFIKIAENSGLIMPIGEWVLNTACAQARKWQDDGLLAVPVAVNVSAAQFRRDGFCELVKKALVENGLAPRFLELELTESILLKNADATLSVLQNLKAMGLHLAIDDFGTGYSSLSYLRHFPVSKLKIDRSFIKNVAVNADDAAIAIAIISMAKGLNLKVIAEGVEDESQMSFLREHQCDEIQGYYFSKPLMADQVVEILGGVKIH
ncbi:MAG TPA: EAL domain-containing protein [Candidatus Acidoferrum sp.]|nr:EAL domain-containing protein [Candidatus Acidoferrum sp.]